MDRSTVDNGSNSVIAAIASNASITSDGSKAGHSGITGNRGNGTITSKGSITGNRGKREKTPGHACFNSRRGEGACCSEAPAQLKVHPLQTHAEHMSEAS